MENPKCTHSVQAKSARQRRIRSGTKHEEMPTKSSVSNSDSLRLPRIYFLELDDHSVLYLSGQFLYGYEPVQTRKATSARQFPCTQFTLRRHKQDNAVVDILCSGEVLEPEAITPPFDQKEITRGGWVSEEVLVIHDKTYDDLKSEREAKMGKRR
jgi:hypothetical protein